MEEIARAAEAATHAQTHAASTSGILPAGAEEEGALGEAWLRDVPGGGSAAVAALRAAHIRPLSPSPSPSSALLALLSPTPSSSSSSPSSKQPQLGPQMDRLQAEFQAAVAPLAAEVDGAVARIRELEARKARLAAELAQVEADQVGHGWGMGGGRDTPLSSFSRPLGAFPRPVWLMFRCGVLRVLCCQGAALARMQALQAGVEGARTAYDAKIAALLASSSASSPTATAPPVSASGNAAGSGAPALAAALADRVSALLAAAREADGRLARALQPASSSAAAAAAADADAEGGRLTAAAATGQLPARLVSAGGALAVYAEVLARPRPPSRWSSWCRFTSHASSRPLDWCPRHRRRRGVWPRWGRARRRGGRVWRACRPRSRPSAASTCR